LSTLADRIRGVLQGAPGPRPPGASTGLDPLDPSLGQTTSPPAAGARGGAVPKAEAVLEGEWRRRGDTVCFVVESRRERSSVHGHTTVGALADGLREAADEVPLLTGFPTAAPFLFFDLETTGLSGGAGTYAFLVGCASFDEDGAFTTKQFMLMRLADEPALLSCLADELSRAGALVSFNGKSFDRPLIESRYLYHRLSWTGSALPHLDMLHVARRFWRRCDDAPSHSGMMDREPSCSLGTLERQLIGHRRHGDVPGFEIPQRYYQFVRTGDARPLVPVLAHNRLDLLSLAALTTRALHLVKKGDEQASLPREALALGHLYAGAGLTERARTAFLRAVTMAHATSMAAIKADALRALAVAARRVRAHEESASYWRQVLNVRSCPPAIARQASEALAIHYEHRVIDLPAAKAFALGSLPDGPRAVDNVRHRVARIERKIQTRPVESPRLDLLSPGGAG
jgi:hypothetical protein